MLRGPESGVHVFLWSLPELRSPGHGTPWHSLTDCTVSTGSIALSMDTSWPAELEPDRTGVEAEALKGEGKMLPPVSVYLELGASATRTSWTVNLAQRHDDGPYYETSMLPEKFSEGVLPGDFKLQAGPEPHEGLLHTVQQYALTLEEPLRLVCGSGLNSEDARRSLEDGREQTVFARNEQAWSDYFASVPQFQSSDPWLTNAYWNRWIGLRLNTVDLPGLPMPASENTFGPFVTEGVGFFRNFVTYSAQAHLREVAWMHSPDLAVGTLDNLAKCQRQDGSYPGHNYSARPARDFYHADFATGLAQLEALHPTCTKPHWRSSLKRYLDYFERERSSEFGSLIFDQNETGQEYMSRYTVALEDADKWQSFRVAGVDATTYMYLLARFLGENEDAYASKLQAMFDPNSSFFCDRLLPEGTHSQARPAAGLYPLMTDIGLSPDDTKAVLQRWAFAETEFWLPRGFPATAQSDPTFSAEGEWKEKRLNCPWNGRSWPMANSHFVDAVAQAARCLGDHAIKAKAGEALLKAVRLTFHGNDPARPNAYEHYDPISGAPSLYRGYDDYMHSWIVDLILRHAVGVRPGKDTVDPLPLDVDWIECRNIPHPRGWMDVRIEAGQEPKVSIRRA